MNEFNAVYELILKITEQQQQMRILQGAITLEMSLLYKKLVLLERENNADKDTSISKELASISKELDNKINNIKLQTDNIKIQTEFQKLQTSIAEALTKNKEQSSISY